VFLLDEPLSNLDAQLRAELRVEIKRLHQRLGATMIYVTHDQIEALTLADRIAVMRDRRIQQLGSPDEVYLRPANRFVATFVGSPAMSFLPGRLAVAGETVRFVAAGIDVPLTGYGFAEAPVDGKPVELEHVLTGAGPDFPVAAAVEMVEPMGSDKLAWTRIGETALSLRLPAETPLAGGDRLALQLPAHRLNLFDAASGQRL
jgi:multiple sugar transport system ATP-binding protein